MPNEAMKLLAAARSTARAASGNVARSPRRRGLQLIAQQLARRGPQQTGPAALCCIRDDMA